MLDSKMTTLLGINDDAVHPCHSVNRVTHGIYPPNTLQAMLYLSLRAGSNVNPRSFREPPPPARGAPVPYPPHKKATVTRLGQHSFWVTNTVSGDDAPLPPVSLSGGLHNSINSHTSSIFNEVRRNDLQTIRLSYTDKMSVRWNLRNG